jgi:hypothetical protein
MSQATSLAPPQPRRRWRRWLLSLPLLLIAAAFAYYFFASYAADRQLAEAIAETDRLDPDWRLEQIEEKRTTFTPEENAAEAVLAAYRLLPPRWPSPPPPVPPAAGAAGAEAAEDGDLIPPTAGHVAPLDDRVSGLPPEVQLDDALIHDLRAELDGDKIKAALAATEPLSRQTGGRYSVTWGPNPMLTPQPCQEVRPVATLLQMRAMLQDQDGEADDALGTARRILIAGRSIGDQPGLISQLVRVAAHTVAVQVLERAMAQGLPSGDALARTQRLLAEDAAEPLLVYALRGERAFQHRFLEGVASHDPAVVGTAGSLRNRFDRFRLLNKVRHYHPAMLRMFLRAVEIARREPEEQAEALRQLEEEVQQDAGGDDDLMHLLMPALGKLAAAFRRDQAVLRGAVVGLALERYRLDKGRWPKELTELVPDYLPAVPKDPFDGRPLRYRPLADGVIVYSVGPDGRDDGGALNRRNVIAAGTDLGFRLWDVTARRQPAAEALPPPDESAP